MKTLTLLCCALVLAACTGKPPEPKAPQHASTPLDPLLKARQRAADVRQTVDRQADAQRKHIEANGQ